MKKVLSTAVCLSLFAAIAGYAATPVDLDELVVLISSTNPGYITDIRNALSSQSPDVELRVILTEADSSVAAAFISSLAPSLDNVNLQLTFGSGEGVLFVDRVQSVPGGVNLTLTNPEVADVTTILGVVDPDNALVRVILIDPDLDDTELVKAALNPSSDEITVHFLLFNPDLLSAIGMALFSGTPSDNIRFTITGGSGSGGSALSRRLRLR